MSKYEGLTLQLARERLREIILSFREIEVAYRTRDAFRGSFVKESDAVVTKKAGLNPTFREPVAGGSGSSDEPFETHWRYRKSSFVVA